MKLVDILVILVVILALSACAEPLPGTTDAGADLVRDPDSVPVQDVAAEGPATDLTRDQPVPDLPAPDLPVPDLPAPDLPAPDMPVPDLLVPDLPAPDLLAPDLPAPDLSTPDLPVSDQSPADKGPVCGDGVRQGTEQCDDGNTVNLDGCDASCKFEQSLRFNRLVLQCGTDSSCKANAFGGAISQVLLGAMLQQLLDSGVKYGEITVLFKLLGLDDLAGKSDPAVALGWMTGKPVKGTGYDGTSDLDWWYKADAATMDAKRNPKDTAPGKIAAGVLTAGPGSLTLPLSFGGSPAQVRMVAASSSAVVGPTSKPLAWTGSPRGHLAAEHLSPTLKSFASAGTTGASASGTLCGRLTAASLAKVPVPAALISFCAQKYTASNSLLDVLVGGCTIATLPAIKAIQPDSQDPGAKPAGAGPPYTLVMGTGKKVTGCQDKDKKPAALAACLAAATYTAHFKFAAGRVVVK